MTILSRVCLSMAWFACSASIAFALPAEKQAESSPSAVQSSRNVDHFDELKINTALQLSEVLEKAYARAPMQASLQSRDAMVLAKNRVANAMLPSAPAIGLIHQNDAIGSGRGERAWQAELAPPVWPEACAVDGPRGDAVEIAGDVDDSPDSARDIPVAEASVPFYRREISLHRKQDTAVDDGDVAAPAPVAIDVESEAVESGPPTEACEKQTSPAPSSPMPVASTGFTPTLVVSAWATPEATTAVSATARYPRPVSSGEKPSTICM